MTDALTGAAAFVPESTPTLVTSPDGTLLAAVERPRITVLSIATQQVQCEIGVDDAAGGCEVGWLGTTPHLLVIQRYAAHTDLHAIDVNGPIAIAELRLAQQLRLGGFVDGFALVHGATGAVMVQLKGTTLTAATMLSRATPIASGTCVGSQFVIAVPGALEEWDAKARLPRRRFTLPKNGRVRWVGGTDRSLWYVTQADPTLVSVIPLVNRGQPLAHPLPEPIAAVAAHPRAGVLLALGADRGHVYAIDLQGYRGVTTVSTKRHDAIALSVNRGVTAILSCKGEELTFELIDAPHRIAAAAHEDRDDDVGSDEFTERNAGDDEPPNNDNNLDDEPAEQFHHAPSRPVQLQVQPIPEPEEKPAAPPPDTAVPREITISGEELSQRVQQWRAGLRRVVPTTAAAAPMAWLESGHVWRDDVVEWTRQALSAASDAAPLAITAISEVVARAGLSSEFDAAITLLYGAHLIGADGVAPAELLRLVGRRWNEALGNGKLAASGLARWKRSRVRLHPIATRIFDERDAKHGAQFGIGSDAQANAAPIIIDDKRNEHEVAAELAARGGGYLIATNLASKEQLQRVLWEAKLRGLVAVVAAIEN